MSFVVVMQPLCGGCQGPAVACEPLANCRVRVYAGLLGHLKMTVFLASKAILSCAGSYLFDSIRQGVNSVDSGRWQAASCRPNRIQNLALVCLGGNRPTCRLQPVRRHGVEKSEKKRGRKAAGVEPTKERLTPLTGFEARAHHRVHLPSQGWPAQGSQAAGHSTLGFRAVSCWLAKQPGSTPVFCAAGLHAHLPPKGEGAKPAAQSARHCFSAGLCPGRRCPPHRTPPATGHQGAEGGCHGRGA